MAKMFYTLEEACQKLGQSEDGVRSMVDSGEIQEFRDGERLMFRREQVDLIAGDDDAGDTDLDIDAPPEETAPEPFEDSGFGGSSMAMGLADTGVPPSAPVEESGPVEPEATSEDPGSPAVPVDEGSGSGYGLSGTGKVGGLDLGGSGSGSAMDFDLGGSGSGSAMNFDLGESGDDSGVAVALEGGEIDDAAAETRVSDAVDEELSLESVGSGSGLLDLTRESDDTSLGAELLDEVWEGGEEDNEEFGGSASGLFESSSDEGAATEAVAVPMGLQAVPMAEAYDGSWSGMGIGLMVGAMAALVCILVMMVVSFIGVTPALAGMITEDLWIWAAGFGGVAILAGLVGLFLGRASE